MKTLKSKPKSRRSSNCCPAASGIQSVAEGGPAPAGAWGSDPFPELWAYTMGCGTGHLALVGIPKIGSHLSLHTALLQPISVYCFETNIDKAQRRNITLNKHASSRLRLGIIYCPETMGCWLSCGLQTTWKWPLEKPRFAEAICAWKSHIEGGEKGHHE